MGTGRRWLSSREYRQSFKARRLHNCKAKTHDLHSHRGTSGNQSAVTSAARTSERPRRAVGHGDACTCSLPRDFSQESKHLRFYYFFALWILLEAFTLGELRNRACSWTWENPASALGLFLERKGFEWHRSVSGSALKEAVTSELFVRDRDTQGRCCP